ncbi:protein-disulfide reductase DsbD [Acinetobacter lactucae]|uniref:Protein-disulfide reductase DsbD n=1 Tax=Acinetobacter lactucae TaxID=1785128 RepID=A0ABS1AHL1_9GAMM|nr:protein-disulfide reductase DsbD [Acinetobacter lactucae]MBJ8437431.1 protein-disulfide reductase DsbD [Acinetobacter lactucae]
MLMKKLIHQGILYFLAVAVCVFSQLVSAQDKLLSPEQAFSFSVESSEPHTANLSWQIQPNYYLYQHKFSVQQGTQPLALKLPKAIAQYDENYGQSQVYYHQVNFQIKTKPSEHYSVTWQGCAKDRICYPPQTIEFQTDADGLVGVQNQAGTAPKRLLDLANTQSDASSGSESLEKEQSTEAVADTTTPQIAQDQIWSAKLIENSLWYGVLLFLGLGMLLAFTPCSLPMLPILTSLIIREHKGLKAWTIALTFVCSMALVYAGLGLIASSAGLNFQRWLQQPATLIAFSLLFIIFALNLFGLFELRLPQTWLNRLDRIQSMQQGGTLVGAGVMGVVSALLVGPCMTAPLAGTLLFISQTQNQWQGALLLFCLGFGMGIPLLLASILGAKFLPKAGDWMHQIKVIFAFLMLGLSLYFIRPLLPDWAMQVLSLALGLTFIAYAVYQLFWKKGQLQWLYAILLLIVIPFVAYNQYQHIQNRTLQSSNHMAEWHIATTAADFEKILAAAPTDRAIVVDVYADWCVACQPIEHRILKSPEVQAALAPYYLIKLDLSHYDQSHEALLKQWNILGPPTYLFLSPEQKEIRALRLTGAFSQQELLQQLASLAKLKDS